MKHFFDIGGNEGQTFDYLATLDRSYKDHKFWVFEPSPRHFAKLLEKCKAFSDQYNIQVCPFGLGGKTEIRVFHEKDDLMGDSFQEWTASDHETHNANNGYVVHSSLVSIREFILSHTAETDTIVLDIDTEGSEYDMLLDLLSDYRVWNRVTEVMVEWHHIKNPPISMNPKKFTEICNVAGVKVVNRGDAELLKDLEYV